jgi:hypothetical protein
MRFSAETRENLVTIVLVLGLYVFVFAVAFGGASLRMRNERIEDPRPVLPCADVLVTQNGVTK